MIRYYLKNIHAKPPPTKNVGARKTAKARFQAGNSLLVGVLLR
jgi:hypothetical protein